MASNKAFRFLDLPPELRNWVYELVLENNETAIHNYSKKDRETGDLGTSFTAVNNTLNSENHKTFALIHTNMQIRQEATPMFFMKTTFIFFRIPRASKWLQHLPVQQKDAVRRMRLDAEMRSKIGEAARDRFILAVCSAVKQRAEERGVDMSNVELSCKVDMV